MMQGEPLPSELEPSYRRRRETQVWPFERMGAVAGAISFVAMAGWDAQVDQASLPTTLFIRLGIAALLLALLGVTFTPVGGHHILTQASAFTVIFGGLSWVLSVLPDGFEVGIGGLSISAVLIPLVAVGWEHLLANGSVVLVVPNLVMLVSSESRFTVLNVNTWLVLSLAFAVAIWVVLERVNRRLFATERNLGIERERADDLLRNILPESVAEQLKQSKDTISARHESVSILFADIVGFTAFAKEAEPDVVVGLLNDLFSRFDDVVAGYGLEKIKTVGDGYMVAAGVPIALEDHAIRIADLALAMLDTMQEFRDEKNVDWEMRIGINSGPVIAGVIGKRKFAYDLWSDAVNVASRMESTGVAGRIQISGDILELTGGAFEVEPRGVIDLRNRGELTTFFLVGRKQAPLPLQVQTMAESEGR
jgi:class 3 adenylate cyclase